LAKGGIKTGMGKFKQLFLNGTELNEVNLSGVTANAAELNLLDGSVAGTAVASKALALGANKNVDVLAIADLKLGAGAGTSLTATAAEINKLHGVGAAIASGTQAALIADPTGGSTTDAEARTAINAIIDALQAFGIVASV
jgi:fructosamine-3-kinase